MVKYTCFARIVEANHKETTRSPLTITQTNSDSHAPHRKHSRGSTTPAQTSAAHGSWRGGAGETGVVFVLPGKQKICLADMQTFWNCPQYILPMATAVGPKEPSLA